MSTVSEFEKLWSKFTTRLQGVLINKSKAQKLTYSIADIVLSDAAVSWSLSYDECGRWMSGYIKENPAKGALIKKILTEDMRFTEVPEKKNIPVAAQIAVPIVTAALGGGISYLLHAKLAIIILSAVVPAVLSYPAVRSLNSSIEIKNKETLIKDYMQQLDKYKNSIVSILSN